jgi:hypothetical protein
MSDFVVKLGSYHKTFYRCKNFAAFEASVFVIVSHFLLAYYATELITEVICFYDIGFRCQCLKNFCL